MVGQVREPRVYNLNHRRQRPDPRFTVYVGRPRKRAGRWESPSRLHQGRWGNPFIIGEPHPETGRPMTRDDVCDLYEPYIIAKIERGEVDLADLVGKHVTCWCSPLRCHGTFLIGLAKRRQANMFEGVTA